MAFQTLSFVLCSALAVDAAAALPSEFQIFAAGMNHTTKGDYLFDAQAAAAVMSEFFARGIAMNTDLEHDSLNPDARLFRSDAADSMGSYHLELRAGALWATQVTWSAEGERRLRSKLQRFTSPAAQYDPGTRRVVRLINVALVSDPATHKIAPLVAASASPALRVDLNTRVRAAKFMLSYPKKAK